MTLRIEGTHLYTDEAQEMCEEFEEVCFKLIEKYADSGMESEEIVYCLVNVATLQASLYNLRKYPVGI